MMKLNENHKNQFLDSALYPGEQYRTLEVFLFVFLYYNNYEKNTDKKVRYDDSLECIL